MSEMIKRIADDLGIQRDSSETEHYWQDRVIYSAVGINLLASACSHSEEDKFGVSMQRVLSRGCELFRIFGKEQDMADTVIAMRETYQQTGYFLHRPNRLAFPPEVVAQHGDVCFTRGQAPWAVNRMSGLGTFTLQHFDASSSFADMFHLGKQPLVQWFKEFERTLKWQLLERLPDNVEFLNIDRSPFEGYWNLRRPKEGISMCKEIPHGRYTLLKIVGETISGSMLDDWVSIDGAYLSIAIALRIMTKNTPSVHIGKSRHIARIKSDYLLPPHEQAVYELFTWPEPGESNPRWNRIAAIEIVSALTDMFAFVGYTINTD